MSRLAAISARILSAARANKGSEASGSVVNAPAPEAARAAPPSPRLAAVAAALKPQAPSSARAPASPRTVRSLLSAMVVEPPVPPPFIEVAAPEPIATWSPARRLPSEHKSITRVEAARQIAELLREKGYFALTHAPLQGRSIVRIDVRKAHGDEAPKVASIWVLLDGRIRVESHPSPFGEESARAVERLVRQALSPFEIQPTLPEEGTKTDALELYQGSSGAWVVGDQHFEQRSDASHYFSSIHHQYTETPLDIDRETRANVPRTISDNERVSFDFDAARVFFRDGQPGVILPFRMGEGESERRGQLRAAERFDRREPGHFRSRRPRPPRRPAHT